VRVECAKYGEDYRIGQIVPIRGSAPADPQVPADAVTASGSGLDPHISIAYADLQVNRVAKVRGVSADLVRHAVADNADGRGLGFFGEPTVNVLLLNLELDQTYPAKG
jgi:K+-transporting ATPase ATPase C chain